MQGRLCAVIEPPVARLSTEEQEQFGFLIAPMVAAQSGDLEAADKPPEVKDDKYC